MKKRERFSWLFGKVFLELAIIFAAVYFAFIIALRNFDDLGIVLIVLILAVFTRTGIEYHLSKK